MNLSGGWGFKYLLLLLPRHFVGTNPATFTTTTISGPKPCYFCYHAKCKLNITHECKGGFWLKYLLLLLPRHTTQINVRTGKLKIKHEPKSRVGVKIPATFATMTYISHERNNIID